MYSRQPMGRFPKGMRVPENYSGNAFAPRPTSYPEETPEEKEEKEAEPLPVSANMSQSDTENQHPAESRPSFKLDLGRFFSGSRGFGTEEFLILALILLLAGSDSSDDTLIFLILLLFIR